MTSVNASTDFLSNSSVNVIVVTELMHYNPNPYMWMVAPVSALTVAPGIVPTQLNPYNPSKIGGTCWCPDHGTFHCTYRAESLQPQPLWEWWHLPISPWSRWLYLLLPRRSHWSQLWNRSVLSSRSHCCSAVCRILFLASILQTNRVTEGEQAFFATNIKDKILL